MVAMVLPHFQQGLSRQGLVLIYIHINTVVYSMDP
jgi:hypothetical protein